MNNFGKIILRLTGGFIPRYLSQGQYQNITLGNSKTLYVDLNNKGEVFDTVPHLKMVIAQKANMFSNMKIYEVDLNTGERVEDSDALRLLMNPNPLQSQEEFFNQVKLYESIYGNNFIYQNKPLQSSELPRTLMNLLPDDVKINTTGKLYDQTEIEGIISSYELNSGSVTRKFDPLEVMQTRVNSSDNMVLAVSPIETLQKPISNIQLALQTRNAILNDRGAMGILSSESKGEGALPLKPAEKKAIEDAYSSSYGVKDGQQKVLVTQSGVKWTPMSYPTKDLMLFEEVEDDFQQIIDTYGMSRDIFSSTKGATFENQEQAIKGTYENTIVPEAKSFLRGLSQFLGLLDRGKLLVPSFDHLDVFESETDEDKILDSQLQLRGSVGGTTGLISLNQSVAEGFTNREAAIQILVNLYGVEEKTADQMVTTLTNSQNNS